MPQDPIPTFTADDYVVRFGWRGLAGSVAYALIWAALLVYVVARSDSVVLCVGVGVGEVVLVLLVARDARRVQRRDVMFAVHRDGVFFGSDSVVDDVSWNLVSSVEFFVERVPSGRSQQVHHCIAVRVPGSQPVARPGNAPGAGRVPRAAIRYFEDAGRRDLLPGADGTIRWACRRMTGWRVDRSRLEEALRHYAPGVTIIDGPNWPPELSVSDAMAAGRARRRRR